MSTALHMPSFAPAPYGLNEKNTASFTPAFTSVNGRSSTSPTEEQKQPSPKPVSSWNQVPRPPEHTYRSSSDSTSPVLSSGPPSPASLHKRRRSDTGAIIHLRTSPLQSPPVPRHPSIYHVTSPSHMDHSHHRSLPPPERTEPERPWTAESREMQRSGYPESAQHDSRPSDASSHGGIPSMAHSAGAMNDLHSHDETEMTRAGVQVELKKRKRQFANRTKTGCGTCRRRKKKCDEAKPECNNCTRGGFICEGYANKIPWPKNGVIKPPPPLQAKERLAAEVSSLYARCPVCRQIHIPHCEPPCQSCGHKHVGSCEHKRQNPQSDHHPLPGGGEGVRARPIVVEEHERKPPPPPPPPPSSWNNGWGEQQPPPPPPPPMASYQSDSGPPPPPPPSTQYTQPLPSHEKQPSREHHPMSHHHSEPPSQHQHTPRPYHHGSISQGAISLPPTTNPYPLSNNSTAPPSSEPILRHQPATHARPPPPQSPLALGPLTIAPPAPAPGHYNQPPVTHKSEKEKMLAGEPFSPFDRQLADERQHCTGAVFRFNSTSSAAVSIASDERARSFKTIVASRWIPPRASERHVVSHLGGNVHVATPFHCDYGYNLSIAENVVIGPNCQLLDSARICIGRNTKIGARVIISTFKTPTDTKLLKGSNGTEIAQQVWIGENVYIGDGCIIEAGVRIGDHTIVRAGSVVVRDLPSQCIAHGNPAFG